MCFKLVRTIRLVKFSTTFNYSREIERRTSEGKLPPPLKYDTQQKIEGSQSTTPMSYCESRISHRYSKYTIQSSRQNIKKSYDHQEALRETARKEKRKQL